MTAATEPAPRTPLQDAFCAVMARVAAPVSVVTAIDGGCPHGTTVSAFASLSLSPPMVVVCLDRDSDLLTLIRHTRRFGLNALGAAHQGWAAAFARKGGAAKFAGIPWRICDGLPRLPGTQWLACEVTTLMPGGDHVIAVGTAIAADTVDGPPLTYHRRRFGTHRILCAGNGADG